MVDPAGSLPDPHLDRRDVRRDVNDVHQDAANRHGPPGSPPGTGNEDAHHQHSHDHDYDYDYDHRHHPAHAQPGRAPGWRRRLRELLIPHSHDTSSVLDLDTPLETSRQGLRALLLSFVGLGVTAAAQAAVVAVTGSVALLGDTLHNLADALTAIPLAIAFTLGRRPPNRRYTYGYGRAEDLAGMVIVVAIATSAVLVGVEAVHRLQTPHQPRYLVAVAAAGLVGAVGNELVARYRIRVGRRIGSAALVADGLHARTDALASLAVLVGAAGVALGLSAADPLAGLLIALVILAVLRDAARAVSRP